MLIIGAGGFAKQLFEEILSIDYPGLSFFDDINVDKDKLWNEYPIFHSMEEVRNYFEFTDKRFSLGVGNPTFRYQLSKKFKQMNGDLINLISEKAIISRRTNLGSEGICILRGAIVEADVCIDNGCLINLNVTIAHDTSVGEYSEISPGVHISGGCTIGRFCQIGTGAVVLPKISIGDSVVIGAGSVVTRDILANTKVVGNPARPMS